MATTRRSKKPLVRGKTRRYLGLSMSQLIALVSDMLSAAPAPVAACFTTDAVREALAENFDSWAEARAQMPEDGQRPLWDLLMDDRDLDNAAFIVWIWEAEVVWLASGTGNSFEVQHFCGQRAAYECDGLLTAMREQFQMPVGPLRLPIRDVESWINRKW